MNFKKSLLSTAVVATLAGTLAAPAQADILDFTFDGYFTMLDPSGKLFANNAAAYYYADPIVNYGMRTPISGDVQFDTSNGTGSATIPQFGFVTDGQIAEAHDITFQSVGNGLGGAGSLIIGNLLFDWDGQTDIQVEIVLDGAGLFAAMPTMVPGDVITGGALPASDGLSAKGYGSAPMGPAPMATTNYNTDGVTVTGDGVGGLLDDGIGGSPMTTAPFAQHNANFDMTAITFVGCSAECTPPEIPVPAAVWLFGSGLLGLVGVARRRKQA